MSDTRGLSTTITRRDFLTLAGSSALGAAGLGILASCSPTIIGSNAPTITGSNAPLASSAPLTRVSTRLNWVRNVEYAGYWFADQGKFFQQETIDSLIIPGGPNAPASVTMVVGGQADVGIQASLRDVMAAIVAGADLVIFATIYQESPIGLLSLQSNPVRTPQDMIGKRIGSSTASRANIESIFKVNHLPVDYTFVPVGFTPDPLIQDQVDALDAFASDQPLVLKQQGIPYEFVSYGDLGYQAYANLLFSTRSYFEENGPALARYLRAVVKGWEMNESSPHDGARLAVEVYGADLGLDLDQQVAANSAQIPYMKSQLTDEKGLMWISKELLGGIMYTGLEGAGLTGLPDVNTIVDTSVLEQAFQGKTHLLGQ